MMRLVAAAVLPALLLLPAPRVSAREATAGPRAWLGGGAALDPAFAALTAGADWFLRPWLAVGFSAAAAVPSLGDPRAVEGSYGFATALLRFRPLHLGRVRSEILAGPGAAWIRFDAPGAHDEWAPDLALGAALTFPLGNLWEVGAEATTHVTLGERAAGRNRGHTSTVLALLVRFGR